MEQLLNPGALAGAIVAASYILSRLIERRGENGRMDRLIERVSEIKLSIDALASKFDRLDVKLTSAIHHRNGRPAVRAKH
jgi:hypothetical protein